MASAEDPNRDEGKRKSPRLDTEPRRDFSIASSREMAEAFYSRAASVVKASSRRPHGSVIARSSRGQDGVTMLDRGAPRPGQGLQGVRRARPQNDGVREFQARDRVGWLAD